MLSQCHALFSCSHIYTVIRWLNDSFSLSIRRFAAYWATVCLHTTTEEVGWTSSLKFKVWEQETKSKNEVEKRLYWKHNATIQSSPPQDRREMPLDCRSGQLNNKLSPLWYCRDTLLCGTAMIHCPDTIDTVHSISDLGASLFQTLTVQMLNWFIKSATL